MAAAAVEIDFQKALSLGIITLEKNLPNRGAISSDDDFDDVNLIEIGHNALEHVVDKDHITLMDALLLLSFDKDGFGRILSSGLGAAIYFELVLREIVSLGKVSKPSFLHPIKDSLISKVEFHASTNIFILDKAIHKLVKNVDVEKEKNLRSVEWMRTLGGFLSVYGRLKDVESSCIQSAVTNALFFEMDHTKLGIFHSKSYQLTPKGQAEQARLIEVVRSFGLNHSTPNNLFDFAVVLLFYILNLHHRNVMLRECVKEDLVFHTKEEITESRKNFDARFKPSK